jgi:hypothetical protein
LRSTDGLSSDHAPVRCGINEPPLLAKLAEAVRQDGVPLAEGELELLGRLRKARNDAVHGRTPDVPLREDIDHALSIVARLLV